MTCAMYFYLAIFSSSPIDSIIVGFFLILANKLRRRQIVINTKISQKPCVGYLVSTTNFHVSS